MQDGEVPAALAGRETGEDGVVAGGAVAGRSHLVKSDLTGQF